jgi:phenylacetate-CoA oxygenase PaaJ subunit
MVTEAHIWKALRKVTDPEFPLSIVDFGMVYGVQVRNGHVKIDLTFTAMGCPAIDLITSDVKETVEQVPGVEALQIEVVWSPPWTKDKITDEGREVLRYYGVGV